jgi:hypothetical protein
MKRSTNVGIQFGPALDMTATTIGKERKRGSGASPVDHQASHMIHTKGIFSRSANVKGRSCSPPNFLKRYADNPD